MNNYSIYPGGRGFGKAYWMTAQVDEALARGEKVAVITHSQQRRDHLANRDLLGAPVSIFSERTFENSRGGSFDAIFVDDANLFHDSPVEMCAHFHPGVPATFTYTPYPFG